MKTTAKLGMSLNLIAMLFLLGTGACATDDQGVGDTTDTTADETAVDDVIGEDAVDIVPKEPGETDEAHAARSAYVSVPSNYVYNTHLNPVELHDYCTHSPDEFPNPVGSNASFHGPCARHDMCLQYHQASLQTCNNRLWSDMVTNCQHEYAWYNPTRAACIDTAHVYWGVVTVYTHMPGTLADSGNQPE
jgi:hypothetical protein